VILTGLIGSAGCGGGSDFRKAVKAQQAGDYAEAVKWTRKAAEQGYAKAQNCLGEKYYNGDRITHDYSEAVKWFRKAA